MEILHSGTPRFWGDWFGRPYDGIWQPMEAQFRENGDILLITFDNAAKCQIEGPQRIENTAHIFQIAAARRIIWEWYSDPCRHRGLCCRLYTWESPRSVLLEPAGPTGQRRRRFDPQGEPAFCLA